MYLISLVSLSFVLCLSFATINDSIDNRPIAHRSNIERVIYTDNYDNYIMRYYVARIRFLFFSFLDVRKGTYLSFRLCSRCKVSQLLNALIDERYYRIEEKRDSSPLRILFFSLKPAHHNIIGNLYK